MAAAAVEPYPDAPGLMQTSPPFVHKGANDRIAVTGAWLLRHQHVIRHIQWGVVLLYIGLLSIPALLPLPDQTAHILNNVTVFAQFVFWGIWWPFVLLSMVLVGRAWCGLLCPEGTLTEVASRHGKALSIPHWMRWKGWPFAAFALTTIYGQMVSVYQYPKPVAIILGGSTLAAVIVGYLYGRSKRVWCRYLCPVNGVFGLLAKLAPLHFRVDTHTWNAWKKSRGAHIEPINCAPLVPIRLMQGNGLCHMCGRCTGFRGAVGLALRSPNQEIVRVAAKEANLWETVLIVFGLIGLAAGAFHWTSSAWLVAAKQEIARRLIEIGILWPLEPVLPWWILTNYPGQNDVLTPLDGVLLITYILASSVAIGGFITLWLAASTAMLGPWQTQRLHHMAQCLIPIAGCGVFLGLSALTVTMLHAEGAWVGFAAPLRIALLVGSSLWSIQLGAQVTGIYACSILHRAAAMVPFALAVATASLSWATLFWQFGLSGH
jgi:polyferredoxin